MPSYCRMLDSLLYNIKCILYSKIVHFSKICSWFKLLFNRLGLSLALGRDSDINGGAHFAAPVKWIWAEHQPEQSLAARTRVESFPSTVGRCYPTDAELLDVQSLGAWRSSFVSWSCSWGQLGSSWSSTVSIWGLNTTTQRNSAPTQTEMDMSHKAEFIICD